MANRETQVANSYESTLSASLAAGATTINVVSTDGTPGTPFFVVIDPDDDTSREVVLVDQGKTGTTLTLSSSASRGLDGTSDVDHDSSAVIGQYPIAALWEDINDRVDSHAHSGGSDGAQVDHGGLGGLGDDDHTQYYNDARHTKAVHDALGLDHGSLSGLGDDDHTQYHNDSRHAAINHETVVGGASVESWSPGNRSGVGTSEGSFTAHSGTKIISDPGFAVRVFAQAGVRTTKGPAVGDTDITFRVRISLDGGSTWEVAESAPSELSGDVEAGGYQTIFAVTSGTPTAAIHVELSSQRNDGASGTVNAHSGGGRVDVIRTS